MDPFGLTSIRKRKRRMQILLTMLVVINAMFMMCMVLLTMAFHMIHKSRRRKRHRKQNRSECLDRFTEDSDDEVSSQPAAKKRKKEKTPTGKMMRNTPNVEDMTSIGNMCSNFLRVTSEMNSNLATIADSVSADHKREMEMAERKKGLFREIVALPGLTKSQVIGAARLIYPNPGYLDVFYSCPTHELKIDFINEILGSGSTSG